MSFRDRYEIAAPWIVVFVGFGLIIPSLYWLVSTERYHSVYQQEATKAQRSEAYQNFNKKCANLPTRQELVECYDNTIETAREPERSEKDLKAQEEMAAWAKGMLVVAILALVISAVGIGVTVVGVVLVAATLKHTRRAADYAKEMVVQAEKTTKAAIEGANAGQQSVAQAQEANAIVKAAYVTEQRPWLSMAVNQTEHLLFIGHDDEITLHVPLRVKNYGKTPAHNVQILLMTEKLTQIGHPVYSMDDFLSEISEFQEAFGRFVILPSETERLSFQTRIDPQLIQNLRRGEATSLIFRYFVGAVYRSRLSRDRCYIAFEASSAFPEVLIGHPGQYEGKLIGSRTNTVVA